MDATLLSTIPNLINSTSIPRLHRRYFSIRLNQLTHRRCSELIRLGSGYLAREFCSVHGRSIQPQFDDKGGYSKSHAVPAGASGAAALSSDAIVLHVRGMLCEGCVASVQRILESQVMHLRNKSALKTVSDYDQLSLESSKISFRWDIESCSTASSACSAFSHAISMTRDNDQEFASAAASVRCTSLHAGNRSGRGNWITTDSEFVVLEL